MQRVALKDAAGEIFSEGGHGSLDDGKIDAAARMKLRKLSSNLSMIASSREDLESASGSIGSQGMVLKSEDEKQFDTTSLMNRQMRGTRTNKGVKPVMMGVATSGRSHATILSEKKPSGTALTSEKLK